jgi:hypothetical protein
MKKWPFGSSEPQAERGQALVLFAFGLVAFCGLVALAIDAGQLLFARTDLQKVSDAAVFAGVQELPNAGSAITFANDYVAMNSGSQTTAQITVSATHSPNDTLTVTSQRQVNYTFLRVFGKTSSTVSATAVGRAARYAGGRGLAPFALIANNDPNSTLNNNPCYTGNDSRGAPIFTQGIECQLKGRPQGEGSDTGALALDATGVNTFRDSVADGTNNVFLVGQQVPSQTGNFSQPTRQGIEERLSKPAPAGCPGSTRDDVLTTQSDGSVTVNPDCLESPRILIIPVVDRVANPNPSTIIGFAFMFVRRVEVIGGAEVNIYGEFVSYISEVPGGVYQGLDGTGPILARLVD